jgi:hypothetical protein
VFECVRQLAGAVLDPRARFARLAARRFTAYSLHVCWMVSDPMSSKYLARTTEIIRLARSVEIVS